MSIVAKVDGGLLVDHELYISQLYEKTLLLDNALEKIVSFQFEHRYFNLTEPYIQGSKTALRINHEVNEDLYGKSQNQQIIPKRIRKRRKRKSPYNHGEIAALNYHNSIKENLQDITTHLCKYLKVKVSEDAKQERLISAESPPISGSKEADNFHCCCRIKPCKCSPSYFERPVLPYFSTVTESLSKNNELNSARASFLKYHKATTSDSNNFLELSQPFSSAVLINNSHYLIPPHTKIFCSDISNMNSLLDDCQKEGKYNCVVLDPPWENKSVRRGQQYNSLPFEQIASIPVRHICALGCLVLIWVTNKQKIMDWVKNTLFPKWNIKYICCWHWVKITTKGYTIFPWDGLHKKPYETLLIGRYECNNSNNIIFKNDSIEHLVLCSVPCSIHSHKPPLCNVLKPYLSSYANPRCLEMFARSLNPNWSSWGNEVLKLQNVSFYTRKDFHST